MSYVAIIVGGLTNNIDIMRFINQDILTGSIDSSQSLNRYAYVEGNPVNYLDPFGVDEMLYEELHRAISEIKQHVTNINVLTAAWVGDAVKMIEINYKIAASAAIYMHWMQ